MRWKFCEAASAKGVKIFDGCVELHIYAAHKIPASASKKKAAAMDGNPAPVKADADNIAKIIADALNGVAWGDDNHVVDLIVTKRYTLEEPYVRVTIREVNIDGN